MSITPDVVKAFHNQDVHSTPESKNAYGSKLRQLLRYMAGQDLVLPTLVFAVSAGCAPHRSIVDVLSDNMVKKIYEYREKASTPIELRDTATVTVWAYQAYTSPEAGSCRNLSVRRSFSIRNTSRSPHGYGLSGMAAAASST